MEVLATTTAASIKKETHHQGCFSMPAEGRTPPPTPPAPDSRQSCSTIRLFSILIQSNRCQQQSPSFGICVSTQTGAYVEALAILFGVIPVLDLYFICWLIPVANCCKLSHLCWGTGNPFLGGPSPRPLFSVLRDASTTLLLLYLHLPGHHLFGWANLSG
eukprot:scaffold175728_cov21-Tisochrysis_lutea.AAC.1